MQLVNGAGTQSYRKCINHECNRLPIGVLRGRKRLGDSTYTIQILFCEDDQSPARQVAMRDFSEVRFETVLNPPWLRRAQEDELRRSQELDSVRSGKVEG